jgi:uncharacterized cupredoxin-like copper-binding protein
MSVGVVLLLAGAGACGGGSKATAVATTERNFAVTLATLSVPAGKVKFNITNQGPAAHELVVFKTDLTDDKMPTDATGRIVEDDPQVKSVADTGGDVPAGKTKTLSADLKAGHYVVVCNLPGHYRAGMHTTLTVT